MTEAQSVAEISHNSFSSEQLRAVVLASGLDSLLQSMLELLDTEGVQIVAVGSDKDCPALGRVQSLSISASRVPFNAEAKKDREDWDIRVLEAVGSFSPDIVALAGFMYILGSSLMEAYSNRIISTHFTLSPFSPGVYAVSDVLDYGVRVTGTIIRIADNEADTGPIPAQQSAAVEDGDTMETPHERIKVVERRLLIDVLHSIADYGIERDGRKTYLK